MDDVFVTGHRNPDMDSVCSAWAYAKLKNSLDPHTTYHAIRCGHLNTQTKETFREIGVEPPALERDVHPRVRDILGAPKTVVSGDAPIQEAIRALHDYTLSVLPVTGTEEEYAGLVSVNEVSDFLISEHLGGRPHYYFRTDNFEKVLPGFCYRQGEQREFQAPIMIGAMPYEVSISRIEAIRPQKPILIVGQRMEILRYAIEQQFPAIVLTGVDSAEEIKSDFSSFRGSVFISYTDTAETIRLLRLSSPVKGIMSRDYPELSEEDHFDEAKEQLIGSEYRGLPVFTADEERSFLGVVTRRYFIDKPRRKVILVDHNESGQSVKGIEQAEVTEILDHHRLAADKTRMPIYVAAKPVGSTCTIVYQHYLQSGVEIDRETALVLISGLLSDTVILKSPTTTEEDRAAARRLAEIAGVDYLEFGERLFRHSAVLKEQTPEDIVAGDFKSYEEQEISFGIAQVEVVTFQNLEEVRDELLKALEGLQKERGLDWTMLLVTNVLEEHSKLLTTPFPEAEERLLYSREREQVYDLPEILSRKKQLLPEVIRVIEEIAGER